MNQAIVCSTLRVKVFVTEFDVAARKSRPCQAQCSLRSVVSLSPIQMIVPDS